MSPAFKYDWTTKSDFFTSMDNWVILWDCYGFGEEISTYGYDGDEVPAINGSAFWEIENTDPELGCEKISSA